MFFRRERPKVPTFAERLEALRHAGFTTSPRDGAVTRVSRDNCAVDLRETPAPAAAISRPGILMGDEIAVLVDGGYQKFFRAPSGKKKPALAGELQALHAFEEDLKEAFGQESYYNQSLGTVSTFYSYDRVQDRDRGVPRRIWER